MPQRLLQIHHLEHLPLPAGYAPLPGRIQRGICRYCFCTERTPCKVSISLLQKIGCSWLDETQTVCSSYNCRVAFQRTQQRQESN
ncbi:MAG TPA: hypothetical protein VI636_09415 [Candidatus Angelobacter sp.]